MKNIKIIIISIILFIFLLFVVNYKNIYYFVYKDRAKDLVTEKMKKKYNIDISVSKVFVEGGVFSFNPVCRVDFRYKGKKYNAVVDTMIGLDAIYDNYQYNEVRKYISDYINKEVGVKYTKMEIFYSGFSNEYFYNLNYLTNLYFDGSNFNKIFGKGSINLSYNVDVINEDKINEIKNKFSDDIRWEFKYTNKVENDKNSEVKDITCIYKSFSYDKKLFKEEKYRLDFDGIRAYGEPEYLKKVSIVKTEPFDISRAYDYDSRRFKVISDYYRTSCSVDDNKTIEFHVPLNVDRKKSYSIGIKRVSRDGKESYEINGTYLSEEVNYIEFHADCWNQYNEYVLLEKRDF